ncbi:MAG: lipase family protein [Leptolyngbya sp. SIO3F4]|nr:lipase family protein [Leptolyngbya sp. SIO3F4]
MNTQETGDTGSFDLTQTAFLFSWIANASATVSGTEQEVADTVYSYLADPENLDALLVRYQNDLIGNDWELVWGPAVYEIKPGDQGEADNTAYVVYSPSQKTYMVAMAGTNPNSALDWLDEDFDTRMVDWKTFEANSIAAPQAAPAPDALKEQITYATAFGVWALGTQLVHGTKSPADGALADFLTGLSGADTRVIFTGHSLGGALSPTLAYWFTLNNKNIDPNHVGAIPVAGPTPGNGMYQGSWDGVFPSRQQSTNPNNLVTALNDNVRCNHDLVPHAWNVIYSGTQTQSSDFYFSNANRDLQAEDGDGDPGPLYSNMGTLIPGTDLRATVSTVQTAADVIDPKETAHPIDFDCGFPLSFMKGDQTLSIVGPLGGVPTPDGVSDYLDALAQIHIWSYGQDAFNIDFSVFQTLGLEL